MSETLHVAARAVHERLPLPRRHGVSAPRACVRAPNAVADQRRTPARFSQIINDRVMGLFCDTLQRCARYTQCHTLCM
jgi:hypothetical protein